MTKLIWDVVIDEARARKTDPETSHIAAASVRNGPELRAAILAALRLHGPMTHEEIIVKVADQPITESGVRTRTAELVRMGDVEPTGERARTRTGRPTMKWRAVPESCNVQPVRAAGAAE